MSNHGGSRPGAGRPKGKVSSTTQIIRDKLADHVDMAIGVLVKAAANGNTICARDIVDRVYGKPRSAPEHVEPIEQPTKIVIVAGRDDGQHTGGDDDG